MLNLLVVVEQVQERLTSTDNDHHFSNRMALLKLDQVALVVQQLVLVSALPALEVALRFVSEALSAVLKVLQLK